MGKKTIKSFTLDNDVVEYLEQTSNASSEVNTILRRHILNLKAEQVAGRQVSEAERASARQWAREQLTNARQAVDDGAYDEIRRQMGWTA
ncbi:MAG: hypothetical protein HOU81_19505 [Hamadaea sp.]|uniref:hypothetical protein n=1 Tax=Hamadaea sp. TaxID=2024425 RepID=UPI001822AD85|nr:hypothetical protein [Hamadaea sp.]NUR73009.1 hypothetical protein [Hamadaea sp.]NUT18046.1 hypothetical protein [Hamadaea sp.]